MPIGYFMTFRVSLVKSLPYPPSHPWDELSDKCKTMNSLKTVATTLNVMAIIVTVIGAAFCLFTQNTMGFVLELTLMMSLMLLI